MTTNFDTNRFAEVKARYEHAWNDLGERIAGGITNLDALAATKDTPQEQARLAAKTEGLRQAQALYDGLVPVPGMGRALGEHTEAWHRFEDRLATLVKAEADPVVREGLLLANGYQRGYGDIDAAPLRG